MHNTTDNLARLVKIVRAIAGDPNAPWVLNGPTSSGGGDPRVDANGDRISTDVYFACIDATTRDGEPVRVFVNMRVEYVRAVEKAPPPPSVREVVDALLARADEMLAEKRHATEATLALIRNASE